MTDAIADRELLEREAFEAHIRKQHPTVREEYLFKRWPDCKYAELAVNMAWAAWQEATLIERARAVKLCNDRAALEDSQRPLDGTPGYVARMLAVAIADGRTEP